MHRDPGGTPDRPQGISWSKKAQQAAAVLDLANLQRFKENNCIEAGEALGGLPESIWEYDSAFAGVALYSGFQGEEQEIFTGS